MYDEKLLLSDYGANYSASGYGLDSNGEALVVNIGGGEENKFTGRLIVRADNVNNNLYTDDNKYDLYLLGGDDSSFTNEVMLAHLELGIASQLIGNGDKWEGKYEIPVSNEMGGVVYPYLRIRHVLSGGMAKINYRAVLGKLA